jgi:hypothetical protein
MGLQIPQEMRIHCSVLGYIPPKWVRCGHTIMKSRTFRFYRGWLIVGGSFYIIDCLVVTWVIGSRLDLPFFERGIYAGGPAGILFTTGWLLFPVFRLIARRINTRPRE